ncbi:MAG: G8 domain-containing protein, partial [Pseudomonadota bacterium]
MMHLNSIPNRLIFLILIPCTLVFFNNCAEMDASQELTSRESESGSQIPPIADVESPSQPEETPPSIEIPREEAVPPATNDFVYGSDEIAFFNMESAMGPIDNRIRPTEKLEIYGAVIQSSEQGPEVDLDGQSYLSTSQPLGGITSDNQELAVSLIASSRSASPGWHNLIALGHDENNKALWIGRNGADLHGAVLGQATIRVQDFYDNDQMGKYHHFVLNYKNGKLQLYWNGQLQGEQDSTLSIEEAQLILGRPVNGRNEFWTGSIANVRIYRKSLTASQIETLFQTDYTQTSSSPMPIDGGLTQWMNEGSCSKTCGGGQQNQIRTCTAPSPSNGGDDCSDETQRTIACNVQSCPVVPPTPQPNPDPLPPPPPVNYGQGGTVEIDHLAKEIGFEAVKALQARYSSTHQSKQSGPWSDPATWVNNQVPNSNANVLIHQNHAIEYDRQSDIRIRFLRVDGSLSFSTNKNTKLVVDTLIANTGSSFKMGDLQNPIQAGYKAEIMIADNGPVDHRTDTQQYGRGLILQGHVDLHGAKKKAYLALDLPANNGRKVLPAGSRELRLKGDLSNWNVGDEIVVMGTSVGDYEDEKRIIQNINGATITLDRPLSYLHDTPSFQTNNVSGISELNIYVGNLTRNILIHSEYKSFDDVKRRGHFMVMYVDGADIRYAAFRDLGRTDKRKKVNEPYNPGVDNPEGRYPLYFHHTGAKVGRVPFVAIGNAVSGSPSWGIVHQDGYGAINENFVYDILGAGIVSEDGNELGEWIGNFVTHLRGAPGRKIAQIEVQKDGFIGFGGIAFECQSRIINIRHNIAANAKIGWSFLGVIGARGHIKSLDDNSPDHPYFKNTLINTTRDPDPHYLQYIDRPGRVYGPMVPSFTNVEYNESIALDTGINSW